MSGTGIILRRRPRDSAALRALTRICPSGCFSFGASDRVELKSDDCTGCGVCRKICGRTGEIEWFADPSLA